MLLANAITAYVASRSSSVSNNGIQPQVTTAAAATMSTSWTSTVGSAGTINADNFFDDIVDTALTSGDLHTKYVNDTRVQDLTMLNRHSQIKHLFKKFNCSIIQRTSGTPLQSGSITTRRNRLSDDMFQKLLLLLLKMNRSFWSE
jgi:hypothetical protein